MLVARKWLQATRVSYELTMEMELPAGPTMSALTSATVIPDVATDPIDMIRSPTRRYRRALPVADIEMISKPPEEEETIVAPIPVSGCAVAGAVIAEAEVGRALNAASVLKRIGKWSDTAS